jgi:hypothetical protein
VIQDLVKLLNLVLREVHGLECEELQFYVLQLDRLHCMKVVDLKELVEEVADCKGFLFDVLDSKTAI